MNNRRDFLRMSAFASLSATPLLAACGTQSASAPAQSPVVISTWNHGLSANEAAWDVLSDGGAALDAVEAGVRVTEADPTSHTVGLGGWPDSSGTVTLDACVMDEQSRCGSVAALQRIQHPTSVARKVMEETPHIMLVGEGALEFARSQGFEETNLLTEEVKKAWEEWKQSQDASEVGTPEPNVEKDSMPENHDTIGMLALDADGNLSGACTTSGTKWKMPGRVGDSPLIGAGLYVDNEVGAACATGWGEAVIRNAGSHLTVERMRQGDSPMEACRYMIERIARGHADPSEVQVGVLALNTHGQIGSYGLQSGFPAAIYTPDGGNRLEEADSFA